MMGFGESAFSGESACGAAPGAARALAAAPAGAPMGRAYEPIQAPTARAADAADLMDFTDFGAEGSQLPAPLPPPRAAPAAAPTALGGFEELLAASVQLSLMDAEFFGAPAVARAVAPAASAAAQVHTEPTIVLGAAADAASAVRPRSLHGMFEASAAPASPGSPGFGKSAFGAPHGGSAATSVPYTMPHPNPPSVAAGKDPFGTPTSLMELGSLSPYTGVGPSPPVSAPGNATAQQANHAHSAATAQGPAPAASSGAAVPGREHAVQGTETSAFEASAAQAPGLAEGGGAAVPGQEGQGGGNRSADSQPSPARAWRGRRRGTACRGQGAADRYHSFPSPSQHTTGR